MSVRRMALADLQTVLGWAADEGWNPGIEDAAAFYAADPEGFFLNEVSGVPVAAVSVVNHDASNAFLGLYICAPDFRGQGHGMAVWQAGMAHAGARCVGLDGVPDQQANYARSGFVRAGRTVRYQGTLPRHGSAHPLPNRVALMQADQQATGVMRDRFSAAWFADCDTRRTLCLDPANPAAAFATYRACGKGVKIGPLHAASEADALALLASVPEAFAGGPIFIDVQDSAPLLADLLTQRGFVPGFETARMYAGTPPRAAPPPFYAIATMELG